MTKYVALLRGINVGPAMQMKDLRGVFESLGYDDVRTVLGTGNVLFETRRTAAATLTSRIENALEKRFGHPIPVILRTHQQLARLVEANPFSEVEGAPAKRPHVSFLKRVPKRGVGLPESKGYSVVGIFDGAVCTVVDLSGGTTPDLMRVLDKTFAKGVTTRTWGTVEKIVRAGATDR